MKNKKNILFLVENGLSSKVIGKMTDNQVKVLVEKFKKSEEKEAFEKVTIPSQTQLKGSLADLAQTGVDVKDGNVKYDQATGMVTVVTKEGEVTEDVTVDKNNATAGEISQDPHQVQAPDGMDDLGDATIDKEEDLATEGEINEKFDSKAQQGLFWARCNKCSDKKCKWCKMAKEFSDSTSKKDYKKMPEKIHPEKTVKDKKKKTNENLEKFLEKKISEMVDNNIDAKMSKKDLIGAVKKKSKSMIIRRPKKMTMFSNEAPMELPIAKMFSIGKK
jgi:hypothetical protein